MDSLNVVHLVIYNFGNTEQQPGSVPPLAMFCTRVRSNLIIIRPLFSSVETLKNGGDRVGGKTVMGVEARVNSRDGMRRKALMGVDCL